MRDAISIAALPPGANEYRKVPIKLTTVLIRSPVKRAEPEARILGYLNEENLGYVRMADFFDGRAATVLPSKVVLVRFAKKESLQASVSSHRATPSKQHT